MLQLNDTRGQKLAEHRLVAGARVPVCADAAYLLARARFLEAVRVEAASARAAS